MLLRSVRKIIEDPPPPSEAGASGAGGALPAPSLVSSRVMIRTKFLVERMLAG
jgi:hypothetical protein